MHGSTQMNILVVVNTENQQEKKPAQSRTK